MTSVPKPLKFLRPHYGTLKAYYETMAESDLKVLSTLYGASVLNVVIRCFASQSVVLLNAEVLG